MDGQLVAQEVDEIVPGKRQKRIVVTDRDIEILKLIHDYRLLRIPQIEALTGRTYTRVHRRLKGLYDAGYVSRRSSPQTRDIYYIARAGLGLLLRDGLITEADATRRIREHELKTQTIDHELLLSDLHVMLDLATRSGRLRLTDWREGEALRDTFDAIGENGAPRRITLNPDAFFQLQDMRANALRGFFLEADRSTMPTAPRQGSQRFRDKIERYQAFIDAQRPLERYGVSAVRVVTITLTTQRRDNLCADADAYLAQGGFARLRKSFLFGSLKDLERERPASVLSAVFRRPGSEKNFELLPPPVESGTRERNSSRSPDAELNKGA